MVFTERFDSPEASLESLTAGVNRALEQQIRAETLAAYGLARCVHPRELNTESLANALEWALLCHRQTYAKRIQELIPSFDGAARLTAYLSRWLGPPDSRVAA